MNTLLIDPFSGISGDMMLAALLDLGASTEYVAEHIAAFVLVPPGTRIEVGTAVKHSIAGTTVDVVDVDGEKVDRMMEQEGPGDSHRRDHTHEHSHNHDHDHERQHGHTHHHHVTFGTIREAIESSSLPERVRERSVKIFHAIAEGEARVHGVAVDDVHFHEVGAVDSIVDIIGVALALESLDIGTLYSRPVATGSGGFIRSQHGTIPVPAPATLEILNGCPVQNTQIPFELTTPTGAGILKALAEFEIPETFEIRGSGFGAGSRDLEARPNLLRISLIERTTGASDDPSPDIFYCLETNVDDMSPEGWPLTFERLLEAGALDVWLGNILMKKGRPAQLLSVLTTEEDLKVIEAIILRETTTIGIRRYRVERTICEREEVIVSDGERQYRVKKIVKEGATEVRPEADDVLDYARRHDVSFDAAYRALESLWTEGD